MSASETRRATAATRPCLRAVVVGDQRLVLAGRGGDLGRRQAGVAVAGEDLVGGIEDALGGVGGGTPRASRCAAPRRRRLQAGAPSALGSIPIAASFFDSERIAYSNISEEW